MNPACEELLQGYPIRISVPVLWGDQDAFGHVNNIVYLRWAESARVEYMKCIGLWRTEEADRLGPILASITCNYRRPLIYPDTVHIGARVSRVGNTSFVMEHRIVSAAENTVAADLDSTLVVLDYKASKTVRVPDAMREAIRKLEESAGAASSAPEPLK